MRGATLNEAQLDIALNRKARKWTRREQLGRLLWSLARPLFRFSPRACWGWRRLLLRLFGATIGHHVHIDPSVRIEIPWNLEIGNWSAVGFDAVLYNLGMVRIGRRNRFASCSPLRRDTRSPRPVTALAKAADHDPGRCVGLCKCVRRPGSGDRNGGCRRRPWCCRQERGRLGDRGRKSGKRDWQAHGAQLRRCL